MRVSAAMKQWLIEAQVYFEIVSILVRLSFLCPYSGRSIQLGRQAASHASGVFVFSCDAV